ncbi:putative DNA gyrase subunit A [Pillotina sp. SPG140]|jgi:DNA gyrase subunit A
MSDGKIIPIALENEVKTAYLKYAMSVIVARALPDVRDGLKPVHRRLLYSMDELGLHPRSSTKKSARIVGDAMGKYHPHGDASLYDALVRMAQDFSLRYPLVQGQGNFGSLDGDPPAASRYTEAKLAAIGDEMLMDLKKETVDFVPNYDESLMEPTVLPAAIPNLLINGSSGIAVGMATNMAPHNLREVCMGICAYIENPDIDIESLMQYIPGPDFPTGGIIYGKKGIQEAYKTGRGKIIARGRYDVEINGGREKIIFSEIPYNVNKLALLEHIATLVREHSIEGIANYNDESDRSGVRIVIYVKRGANVQTILNQLFAHTALQSSFVIANVALVDRKPKTLNLKELISHFVEHRVLVITRRTQFDLAKTLERIHILEGFLIALNNIDRIIHSIKASKDTNEAITELQSQFNFSQSQVHAIIDMRLGRLTGLEHEKINTELANLVDQRTHFRDLLADKQKIYALIKEEMTNLAERFGDKRRTELIAAEAELINIEDLIKKEDMVILISNLGYIKRVAASLYQKQNRGGKGVLSAKLIEEDSISQMFIASTHEYLMCISNAGKAYCLKVHEVPEGTRISKGTYINTILKFVPHEEVSTIVALDNFSEEKFLFMGTAQGKVKKTPTSVLRFAKLRGTIAIRLEPSDRLVGAILTSRGDEVVLVSKNGKALRTAESNIRPSGKSSGGVRGLKLREGDELIGILTLDATTTIVLISQNGFGKRVEASEFNVHGRGTYGQIIYNVTEKTGPLVACVMVREDQDLLCTTNQGKSIRIDASTIRVTGRTASGIRIVNLAESDFVIGVDRIVREHEE